MRCYLYENDVKRKMLMDGETKSTHMRAIIFFIPIHLCGYVYLLNKCSFIFKGYIAENKTSDCMQGNSNVNSISCLQKKQNPDTMMFKCYYTCLLCVRCNAIILMASDFEIVKSDLFYKL